jgi:triacylglycerol esterase/lipase EstA (alpha/beta hydrolase family)
MMVLLVATSACDRTTSGAPSSGPALSVTKAQAEASLGCPATFAHADHATVLLVHGTTSTPEESWSWNLQRGLPAAGWDTCTVRLPDRSMGDIQVSSEYVVAAVRILHERTHRKVSIVGHSQGALEARWAAKWWPDVRRSVDDLIMLAGPNHGSAGFQSFCAGTACSPAVQQMREGSMFLGSLNLGSQLPAGVSVTSIYSATDEYVQPATGPGATAALPGASNIMLQSICTTKPVDHVAILFNAAAYALIIDALRSPGPADATRVPVSVCGQATAPDVDLAQGTALLQGVNRPDFLQTVPGVPAEPPLKPYARI